MQVGVFDSSQRLGHVRRGEVEDVLLERLKVDVFERAEAGHVERQMVLARLGGVEEAARGDGVEGGE